jgi:SagB-type dehydrogenase family enzyme
MAPGDTARLYHRLSSFTYVPEAEWPTPTGPPPIDDPLVLQDFVPYDFERMPPHCKDYPPGLPVVELPREWPRIETPATTVLAGQQAGAPAPLDLPGVARLMHLSAGVVRVRFDDWRNRTWLFRAAGSAGGRFPLEVYVSARGVEGLPDGVHWYDPVAHALVQVGPPAGGEATTLVVTGVPWRTSWRYGERGFRHVYWDAGSMLAQTLVLADSAGFCPRLWTRFADAEIARLVGADLVQEFPVAVVGLGPGEPAVRPFGDAARGSVGEAPVEFPLITMAQRAGDEDRLGDPWPAAGPLPGEVPTSAALDTAILQRGSTRLMDPTATVSRGVFDFSLAASLRGARVPHFIAVHAVEGVDPGLYRWPDLEHPLRREPLRQELLLVCWDQDLGRDAAFVVVAAVDLETLDDRGYREAQLEAGIVEGRLHLAAYALGIGASGMTFLDAEIEGLLREPLAGMLITCVGVPTYRNKAGGRPGEPVSIRRIDPGETPRAMNPPRSGPSTARPREDDVRPSAEAVDRPGRRRRRGRPGRPRGRPAG